MTDYMKLTPLMIKQQEFHKSLRGLDENEVKTFLAKVADELEELNAELEKLKSVNADLEKQIDNYRKIERNLQNTLLNAQESTTKTVESVKKQAALILKEAELKAKQMIEKAREEAELIKESVAKLREEKNFYLARLQSMIESQEKILDLLHENKPEKRDNYIERKFRTTKEIDSDEILEKLL